MIWWYVEIERHHIMQAQCKVKLWETGRLVCSLHLAMSAVCLGGESREDHIQAKLSVILGDSRAWRLCFVDKMKNTTFLWEYKMNLSNMTGYGVGGLETGASWDRRTPTLGLEGCRYQYLSLKPDTTHNSPTCIEKLRSLIWFRSERGGRSDCDGWL